ncbi:MAG TPA: response regulator [Bryobacteraceae bacterium]|nr:response regulator [Bryobacteraceae bacterium]
MTAILVVEDDAANREVFLAALRRKGFQVTGVASAKEAFALSRHHGPIDLLIADVLLPDGSGVDVALRMRQWNPNIPILFTSGTPIDYWNEADARNLQALPPDSFAFLPKPFICSALTTKVGELLTRVRLPRTA